MDGTSSNNPSSEKRRRLSTWRSKDSAASSGYKQYDERKNECKEVPTYEGPEQIFDLISNEKIDEVMYLLEKVHSGGDKFITRQQSSKYTKRKNGKTDTHMLF